jgi:hypothetical protein
MGNDNEGGFDVLVSLCKFADFFSACDESAVAENRELVDAYFIALGLRHPQRRTCRSVQRHHAVVHKTLKLVGCPEMSKTLSRRKVSTRDCVILSSLALATAHTLRRS